MNEQTAQLNKNTLALGGLQTFFLVTFALIVAIASTKIVVCYV